MNLDPSSNEDEFISGINVTPLVDVTLVLLIIFLVTAPVLYQSHLKINLPTAKTGTKGVEKTTYFFSLNKKGELTWGEELIDWKTLSQRLKSRENQLAEETATISADEATPHGIVIRLMDALREAGLTHFALHVESITH